MKAVLKILPVLLFVFLFVNSSIRAQESADDKSVLAKEIINKYVEAIGGKDALSAVEDRTTIMRGNVMGQNLTLILRQKWPNKLRQEIKAGGMEQLVLYNGEKAVMTAAGQTIEVTGKELDALQLEASMDLLFDPEIFGIKLSYEGEDTVDSIAVHKVIMTLPSGIRWFQYYDKETGLKVKESKEMQTQMGLLEQETYYLDYKEVEGKLYPFKIKQSVGTQSFEISVSSIKINAGLDDSIFEPAVEE